LGAATQGIWVTTVKARAYLSAADQTISTGTPTKITLDGEAYDPGTNFDNVTNYRFVAPISGYYSTCGAAQFLDVVANKIAAVYIYKNDAAITQSVFHTSIAGESAIVPVADIIYLAATEYIELWVYHNFGVNKDVNAGINATWMACHFLSN